MSIANFIIIYLIINVVTFLVYGLDKFLAKKEMHRISEKALFILALCLGGVGAIIGMYTFRHKTKKTAFKIGIPILIIINIVSIYYLLGYIIK